MIGTAIVSVMLSVAGVQNVPPPPPPEPIVTAAPEPTVDVTPPVLTVQATFYMAFCNTGCIGVTATGIDVSNSITYNGHRIIAVDPNVIPLWSIVNVSLSGGESFTAIALDTGGAIRGSIIDVLVSDSATASRNGRQTATITYIRKGKS